LKQVIESHIRRSSEVKLSLLKQQDTITKIIDSVVAVSKQGGTIYSCGNGGSACDAMHLTEELIARYLRERPGIKAQHFCDSSTLSCWSNDYNYDSVFERQASTFTTKADALIVFSTSGNSPNILKAIEAANANGATTIALLGKGGGKAKSLAKLSLVVDSDATAHIQECHITLVHIICDRLEVALFGE